MYSWACSRGISRFSESHLGHVALVLRQLGSFLPEHFGGRRRVDVLALGEGLAELRLAGDVGEDA